MSDVISLSELSDEPAWREVMGNNYEDFSPRLAAVLCSIPNNSTGTATRVKGGLLNAGILTVATLLAADRYTLGRVHLGRSSIAALDATLKRFGLHRVDENPPIVVRDGAALAEAQVLRLMKWIDERMSTKTTWTEREVLRDVMRVLDGQDATNLREWTEHDP